MLNSKNNKENWILQFGVWILKYNLLNISNNVSYTLLKRVKPVPRDATNQPADQSLATRFHRDFED